MPSRRSLAPFSKLPSWWIDYSTLEKFKNRDGVSHLKTLMALAIARGQFERKQQRHGESFPASIDTLSDHAHLRRRDVVDSCRFLVRKEILRRVKEPPCAGLHPRTSIFEFNSVRGGGFFPVPYKHLDGSGLLQLRSRSPTLLTALKCYLVFGRLRNTESGRSRIGYSKLEDYAIKRKYIRRALSLLIEHGLVEVMNARELDELDPSERHTNEYLLKGL